MKSADLLPHYSLPTGCSKNQNQSHRWTFYNQNCKQSNYLI